MDAKKPRFFGEGSMLREVDQVLTVMFCFVGNVHKYMVYVGMLQ